MEKIPSFCVNHLNLNEGIYLSRKDEKNGVTVTTFDLRMTKPNREPVMDSGAIHSIEHICATFMRNSEQKNDVIYFGPMGCKTGFYLVMFGDLKPIDVLDLVKNSFSFVASFEGEIPGANPKDCGNYSLQNIEMAKYYAKKYLNALENEPNFEYFD